MFFNYQMSAKMQARMRKMLNGMDDTDKVGRVRAALTLTSLSPEFVVQK